GRRCRARITSRASDGHGSGAGLPSGNNGTSRPALISGEPPGRGVHARAQQVTASPALRKVIDRDVDGDRSPAPLPRIPAGDLARSRTAPPSRLAHQFWSICGKTPAPLVRAPPAE